MPTAATHVVAHEGHPQEGQCNGQIPPEKEIEDEEEHSKEVVMETVPEVERAMSAVPMLQEQGSKDVARERNHTAHSDTAGRNHQCVRETGATPGKKSKATEPPITLSSSVKEPKRGRGVPVHLPAELWAHALSFVVEENRTVVDGLQVRFD